MKEPSLTDDSEVPEIDTWEEMIAWLVTSFTDQPVGLIIDLGPSDYVSYVDDEDFEDEEVERVVCAQVHVLADGVLMVRRSEPGTSPRRESRRRPARGRAGTSFSRKIRL